jgi:hypothetical protein
MSTASNQSREHLGVGLLLIVTVAVVGYMLLRLNGMFASNDVAVYTRVATAIQQSGSLTTQPAYSNGFGYATIVALLSSFTGLSITQLQVIVLPFLLIVPILAGYVTFREILDTRRGLFAALLLLVHPFFLFTAFRTTHEKFTYTFILLAIFALYVTFASESTATKGRFILAGYLVILGIIFLNVFFASSFIVGVAIGLGCTFVLSLYYGQRLSLRRLGYTLGISFALLMVVVLFLYPPARNFVASLGSVSRQSVFLLLGNAPSAIGGDTSPYQSAFTGWNSFGLYLVLIGFYLVVYPVAGLYWLVRTRSYLSRPSIDQDDVPHLFVHLLFFVFGIQFAVAIVADQTGLLGGNTQIRIFPILGFIAIILATVATFRVLEDSDSESPMALKDTSLCRSELLRANVVPLLLVALVLSFGITGVVKATSEPAASHQWTVTTPDEQATVGWTEETLQDEYLWGGYEARLRFSHLIHHPDGPLQNRYDPGEINIAIQYLVYSDTIEKRAEVVGAPLPPRDGTNRVYTNGDAQVYWFEQYQTLDDYNDALRRSQQE